MMAAYEDFKLSEWIQEHPADLFHLIQSNIQWTFYLTKGIEYLIFAFAIWRSLRVNRKKWQEQSEKVEDDQTQDKKAQDLQMSITNNVFKLRDQFFK